MANIKLGDLYLSKEESKDIIELLAKKRNSKNYKSKSSDKSGYNKNYAQYESKGDKILSLKEYLSLIEKGEWKVWKVQLTIEVNFISLKPGSDETFIMYTRSDNIERMFGDDNDDIIEQLFESLLKKYEENLQNKMRGSEFEFDGVNFLYYDFNRTSINSGGSYIDSPKWLKDKKSTINPKNNDDKYFQYAVTLALNLDKIKKPTKSI